MNVLLDLDEVLMDTARGRLEWMNKKFNTTYTKDNLTSWACPESIDPSHDAWSWSEECFLSDVFQINCEATDGALDSIHALSHHNFIVVSDRPESLYTITRTWLDVYGLYYIPLIFTRSVHSLNRSTFGPTKIQVAYQRKLNMVIEDSPYNSLNLAVKSYVDKVYLLDRPYNKHVSHDKIIRVKTWDEIRAKEKTCL